MTLTDYQRSALRTANLDTADDFLLAVFTLGLCGEGGEVAEMVKKHLGHGKPLDRDALVKELGDVLWYLAAVAGHQDITLDEVADRNIAKLLVRYPDGFSHAASSARIDITRP